MSIAILLPCYNEGPAIHDVVMKFPQRPAGIHRLRL